MFICSITARIILPVENYTRVARIRLLINFPVSKISLSAGVFIELLSETNFRAKSVMSKNCKVLKFFDQFNADVLACALEELPLFGKSKRQR